MKHRWKQRNLVLPVIIMMVICLAGCSSKENEQITLEVFAASSLTEVLNQLQMQYEEEHPDIKIEYNFDSSGTLKSQIEAGAECDVFISAAEKQMDELTVDIKGGTRIDLLENQVVLAVPEGNPAQIENFEDLKLKELELLAIGNEDVPVGQYSKEILEYLGIFDELNQSMKITYGSNAKEVTTQVSKGLADAGIVFRTDAVNADLEIVDVADVEKGMCSRALYPVAVLEGSEHTDQAMDYVEFLQSEDAGRIFEETGFALTN